MEAITEEQISEAAFLAFLKRGLNFTTDDLADELGISKRTLYRRISSKNEVIRLLIDKERNRIKEIQKQILNNDRLSSMEKMKKLLTVQPESESRIMVQDLRLLKRKYPEEFKYLERLYSEDWEDFFRLMEQEISLGRIREINPRLFRDIYLSAVTSLRSDKAFPESIAEITDILFHGIIAGDRII